MHGQKKTSKSVSCVQDATGKLSFCDVSHPILTTKILLTSARKKGKAVPSQAYSGPEGFRKLRFPDFMTTAQDGGKVVSLTHRPPLPQGNTTGTNFC